MKTLNALTNRQLMNTPNEGAPGTASPALISEGEPPPSPAVGEGGDAPAAPEPVAPLTRADLVLPENFTDAVLETVGEGEAAVKVTAIDRALEIINNAELSNKDRTQQLIDLQLSLAQRSAAEAEAAWTGMQDQWRQEAQNLPEIGGAAFPETLAVIKKGLNVIGADASFYEAMTLTGAGNHPAVVRVLHALTKNLSEGKPVSGDPPKAPLTLAERLYPTMRT